MQIKIKSYIIYSTLNSLPRSFLFLPWAQPRTQGPLSSTLEKVPYLGANKIVLQGRNSKV